MQESMAEIYNDHRKIFLMMKTVGTQEEDFRQFYGEFLNRKDEIKELLNPIFHGDIDRVECNEDEVTRRIGTIIIEKRSDWCTRISSKELLKLIGLDPADWLVMLPFGEEFA